MTRTILVAASAVTLVAATSAATPPQGDVTPALLKTLQASRAYVRDYEEKLTFIVADEDYEQQIRDQVPIEGSMPQGRKMKSEVDFIFAPQTGTWMAIRDVVSVDGKPVADRPNLMTLLGTTPAAQVDATVKARNSRFNIGRTVRNFNEPTLALQMLDANRASSVEFKLAGTQTDHGTSLATLAFREPGPTSLIRDLRGQPAPSTGGNRRRDRHRSRPAHAAQHAHRTRVAQPHQRPRPRLDAGPVGADAAPRALRGRHPRERRRQSRPRDGTRRDLVRGKVHALPAIRGDRRYQEGSPVTRVLAAAAMAAVYATSAACSSQTAPTPASGQPLTIAGATQLTPGLSPLS